MEIAGSEYLVVLLHALAQSLLLPVLLGLLLMALFTVVEVGSFLAERQCRKRADLKPYEPFTQVAARSTAWQEHSLLQALNSSTLNAGQQKIIREFAARKDLGKKLRKVLARAILDREEHQYEKILNRTELVSRLGPVLGLMGTLIPLGPGLAALGQGDLRGLSEAVIIAFDTTVMGIGVGAACFVISRVRRGWYQKDLNYMESILDLLEGRNKAKDDEGQEKKGLSV